MAENPFLVTLPFIVIIITIIIQVDFMQAYPF